jgi:DHA2 family multidrug resistance protein
MGILGMSVVGLSSVLPMMFQTIYGYPVMDTGLLMAPRGIGVMMTSMLAGYMARHFDFRLVIFSGYLVAAAGMWGMTGWALEMDSTPILIASFVQGLGFGLIVSPMNVMAFSSLSPQLRPDGSSLMALFRSFGGSVGISLIVTMLSRNQQVSHADLAAHVTADAMPGVDLPAVVDRLPGIGEGALAMINGEVSRQALMIAFLDNFMMLFWIMLIFAPLPLLLKKPKPLAQGERLPIVE